MQYSIVFTQTQAFTDNSMATIKDVAREAGVSTATVSRVLNNGEGFSEETRLAVLTAIEALDYKPSRVARNLRVQRTQLLGLILSDIQNPFFTSVIQGVEEVAHQNGYSLILCNSDENPEREQMYLRIMHQENVAGMILATTVNEGHEAEILCGTIPTVAIDRTIDDLSLDTVVVDSVLGAQEAVSHLLRLGHERIGLINGLQHVNTAKERQEGYVRAHHAAAMQIDPDLIRYGNFKQDSGYTLSLELLSMWNRPTALFVANNLMTLGALNAIHELQLRIPDDVAIVGFDDMPWSASLNPPLTAVAQPHYELGQSAAELLLKHLSGNVGDATKICLKPHLVVRRSCGAQLTTSS